jgi:PAS domain S-box-containing protein
MNSGGNNRRSPEEQLYELEKRYQKLERKYKKLSEWRNQNISHSKNYRLFSQKEKIRYWSLDFDPEELSIVADLGQTHAKGFEEIFKLLEKWFINADKSDYDDFIQAIRDSIANNYSPIEHIVRFTHNGKERWIKVICEYFKDADGIPFKIFGANIDVTENVISRDQFFYQLKVEETIAKISTDMVFLDEENRKEKLQEALKEIGETINTDYICLVWTNKDQNAIEEILEWGKDREKYSLFDFITEGMKKFKWFRNKFTKKEAIIIEDINKFPKEATLEKESFSSHGIKSALLFPFYFNRNIRGHIGFYIFRKKRNWKEEDIRMIKILATIFSGVYQYFEQRKELLDGQKFYQLLFELSPSGIVLEDENGIIFNVNPAYCNSLGYTREELVGKHVSIVTEKTHRKKVDNHIEELKYGKELRHIEKTRRKDGSFAHLLLHEKAIEMPNSKKGILCITEDISERISAEEALKESEERYRNLTEYSPEAIAVHVRGRLVYVNQASLKLMGAKSKEELIGKNILDIVHPDYHRLVIERAKKAIKENAKLSTATEKFIRSDGEVIDVETTALGITYNKKPAAIIIVRDITDRKRTEEQNRKLQERIQHIKKMEAIGTLAGGIAHDFNNILTIINGHAELMAIKAGENNPLYNSIRVIMNAGKRAQELTGQILAFSRKQHFSPRNIQLDKVIDKMREMLKRFAGKNIDLNIIHGKNLPVINADPGQIEQVLMNLVINAKDAIEAKKNHNSKKEIIIKTYRVQVTIENRAKYNNLEPGEYAGFSVFDTGTGIAPEIMERIFEPFFTTKDVDKGTGLGLATVYGIIKQNNAFIQVQNKPESGAQFEIFWPGAAGMAEQMPDEELLIENLTGTEKIVVIISDNDIRSFTVGALRNLGYKVLEMKNFMEVKTFLSASNIKIDLLIFDLILFNESEEPLMQRMGKEKKPVKMLLVSGYSIDYLMDKGMISKDIEYMQKPFSINSLAVKVRSILDA